MNDRERFDRIVNGPADAHTARIAKAATTALNGIGCAAVATGCALALLTPITAWALIYLALTR